MVENKKQNEWVFAGAIVVAFILGAVFGQLILHTDIGKDAVKARVIQYMTDSKISGTVTNITGNGSLYLLTITTPAEGAIQAMATRDGKLLMPLIINLDAKPETPQPVSNDTVQKARPSVELFVMSECPYGLQMEKGIIPVIDRLNGTIDFQLKFVNYAMHGAKEVKEEQTQYCIQGNTPNILPYLKCYVVSGNSSQCLPLAQIDRSVMQDCITFTEKEFEVTKEYDSKDLWLNGRFPRFRIFEADNTLYGVKGSPTLVINGKVSQAGRDSQSLLNAICEAFTVKPEACGTAMPSTQPTAGFGAGTGSAGNAQCT